MDSQKDRFREYARQLLLHKMRDISEDAFCAGWMSGLEYDLYAEVVRWLEDDHTRWGEYGFRDVDREELYTLAKDAGGWWSWDSDEGEPVFIETVDWLVKYNEYLGSKNGV